MRVEREEHNIPTKLRLWRKKMMSPTRNWLLLPVKRDNEDCNEHMLQHQTRPSRQRLEKLLLGLLISVLKMHHYRIPQ